MSEDKNWDRLIELLYAKESFETIKIRPGRVIRIRRSMWDRLEAEGNHSLIAKLKAVERKEAGYGTIVVPEGGFSKDTDTHEEVMQWLRERHVSILNPAALIKEMKRTLS